MSGDQQLRLLSIIAQGMPSSRGAKKPSSEDATTQKPSSSNWQDNKKSNNLIKWRRGYSLRMTLHVSRVRSPIIYIYIYIYISKVI